MPIERLVISGRKLDELLERGEGHFLDFKSIDVSPAKLTRSLSAFANADSGELYIGIENEVRDAQDRWRGFEREEHANGLIQTFEQFFPLGAHFRYEFIGCEGLPGLIVHCEIAKTPDIRSGSDRKVYLRRGAQSLPQITDEQLLRLKLNKGITSYEDGIVNIRADNITNSFEIIEFIIDNVPDSEPDRYLRKQQLLIDERPTVSAVLLYSDDPQAALPYTGLKIYQYKTAEEGTRDTLVEDPMTVEGSAYKLIQKAVEATIGKINAIPVLGSEGFEKVSYPREAIHEIITNAVLHRDYSINDEIHVRIFNNRIEVQSPGTLPGHVTVANILEERFSRNPRLVRLINKYRNPPNKDVGEGLNMAFEAMRKLKLKDPIIEQREGSVRATLKHESLATAEEVICTYLRNNEEINNSIARAITFIGSENAVKRIFQKMTQSGVIMRIPGRAQSKAGYRKGPNFPQG
jgi:ATP-dependent DNA helicase RecG